MRTSSFHAPCASDPTGVGGRVWEEGKARKSAFWVVIVPLIVELLLIHRYIFE